MKIREITDLDNSSKINEGLPAIPIIVAGARLALPWLTRKGANILAGAGRGAAATPKAVAQVGTGVGRAGTGVGIGATGLAVNDIVQMAKQGIGEIGPVIESILGSIALKKIINFSSKYGLPILVVVAILYGGKKIINSLKSKGESIEETATAGGTSAGGIATVAQSSKKQSNKYKNKDGTVKNALDVKGNIFTGIGQKR